MLRDGSVPGGSRPRPLRPCVETLGEAERGAAADSNALADRCVLVPVEEPAGDHARGVRALRWHPFAATARGFAILATGTFAGYDSVDHARIL